MELEPIRMWALTRFIGKFPSLGSASKETEMGGTYGDAAIVNITIPTSRLRVLRSPVGTSPME